MGYWFKESGLKNGKKPHNYLSFHIVLLLFAWPVATMRPPRYSTSTGIMAGHSILYLGRGEFAADYLSELETLPVCALLTRSALLEIPDAAPSVLDIILIEAGPTIAQSGKSISDLIGSMRDHPVVALTTRDREHRGIAAVRAGAQAYICVDDITVEGQESVFEHAVQRHRLQHRLSDTDVTVLSILRNINDGVIVVDQEGHVLDINPAARSILGIGPRMQPDTTWEAGGAVVTVGSQ